MKTYVTFGQSHTHRIGDKIFDRDTVAIVEGDRERVFELFGPKFCFEYPEEVWKRTGMDAKMHYFPKGYLEVPEDSPPSDFK